MRGALLGLRELGVAGGHGHMNLNAVSHSACHCWACGLNAEEGCSPLEFQYPKGAQD